MGGTYLSITIEKYSEAPFTRWDSTSDVRAHLCPEARLLNWALLPSVAVEEQFLGVFFFFFFFLM